MLCSSNVSHVIQHVGERLAVLTAEDTMALLLRIMK